MVNLQEEMLQCCCCLVSFVSVHTEGAHCAYCGGRHCYDCVYEIEFRLGICMPCTEETVAALRTLSVYEIYTVDKSRS